MPDVEEAKALIVKFNELSAARKAAANSQQRIQMTQQLNDLEQQIRNIVKNYPVPEPLGMTKLESLATQLKAAGYDFLAVRLTGQQYRHPSAIPFQNMEHVREYIGAHVDDPKVAQILEAKPRKKLFGMF